MLVGAGIIVVAAFASVLLLWLCGRDVVPRNRVVGIRLPALLASDAAWRAGHSAAVGPAGAGALVGALVLAVSALGRSDSVLEPILVVIVMIGALGWAAVVAVRAARHAPSGPEREVVDHTGDARPLASVVVFVGDDIGRVSGSIGLGSLTVLTGSFALMWITAVTAAETPSTSVFLLVPVGLLIGSLVFVLATIRPPGASATTSSE
ncbi:SdpI family protein [Microbacterium sp. JC 701]|uniref:SdpI family protein n=1 Tax=Microbacterium sp. JC 701 TaxID=2897389 RepID=UPI001E4B71DA|nr:SdpI family protein [Microbacterium sp. JC 701]MCD2169558.1 SdpI family protein [Microbacterium sp. JC 701]